MKEKRIYKLFPCPTYDIEGLESFFSQMAKEGYSLVKDGLLPFGCYFAKRTPQSQMYRLEAMAERPHFLDNDGEPDPETVELSRRYGWEYVTKCGEFYVYVTSDPEARELNTDPAVQAIALEKVKKRRIQAIFSPIFFFGYALFRFYPQFLTATLHIGSLLTLFTLFLYFCLCYTIVKEIVFLTKLIQKLKAQEPIDHGKDWRIKRRIHLVKQISTTLLVAIWLCLVCNLYWFDTQKNGISLQDYQGDLPFATLLDLTDAQGADYTFDMRYTDNNEVREWSDPLAPYNADYQESASITTADGQVFSGWLDVDYHQTVDPALAHTIAAEYFCKAKESKYFSEQEAPDADVDYIKVFTEFHFTSVILQKGNTVQKITAYAYSDSVEIDWNAWIAQIAAQMDEGTL